MIRSVNHYPISQLFDIESNIIYTIPRYQREYSWVKSQWESLFDDVWENEKGYFLGSIICINQTNDTFAIQNLELVDGQQRLITLSLLFLAVYDLLIQHRADMSEDQLAELINLKRKLVLKGSDERVRLIPQIHNNNQNDYFAILSEKKIISVNETPSNAGNRKIYRAFRYFLGRLNQMIETTQPSIDQVFNFLDKINQASIVKIEVVSHSDAYTLFESLNNRGMPLSAIDLIKNKLLAKLEGIESGKIDHHFKSWNYLLGHLGDDYSTQERFFRQYYNAFKEKFRPIFQVPVATRSNLIQIYEHLIDNDPKIFLENILKASRVYSFIILKSQSEDLLSLEKPLRDLERIQGAPSYLLMLYLLYHRSELNLNAKKLVEIIGMLVSFFVRRNLTDTPPTRDLTRLFMSIVDKISQLEGTEIVSSLREQLVSISASDEMFNSKLRGSIYDENSGVTRFILCALAEKDMTRESWVDLWKVENRQFVWTIEHIFPQGENIPKGWVEMIADGDYQKAKELQSLHVHKLGNLTITGFNSSLGNKSFTEKKNRVDRNGRHVGYANGLKMNEGLMATQSWSVEEIERRTEDMIGQVIALFNYESCRYENI